MNYKNLVTFSEAMPQTFLQGYRLRIIIIGLFCNSQSFCTALPIVYMSLRNAFDVSEVIYYSLGIR
jgi:hypothetical protein